jgi:ubiquinone/menaquinone biosynthesis C-methylase UbiE
LTGRANERAFVRTQYETEDRLRARKSVYANAEGDDPREFAFQAVAEVKPRRVLEVGGGEGELAERIVNELGAELVGIDQSARMVEIQRSKGIDARVGDVQNLPFADGEFDVAVAAWMLYHVPDIDHGLAELARVLKPGGRFVAVTNSVEHFQELRGPAQAAAWVGRFNFRSENGEEVLARHFARLKRREARGWVTMDGEAIRRFAESLDELASSLIEVPEHDQPLRVRRHSTVFVAETARGAPPLDV